MLDGEIFSFFFIFDKCKNFLCLYFDGFKIFGEDIKSFSVFWVDGEWFIIFCFVMYSLLDYIMVFKWFRVCRIYGLGCKILGIFVEFFVILGDG